MAGELAERERRDATAAASGREGKWVWIRTCCRIVRRCLQRRATAPWRIGVGYHIRELNDPRQWLPVTIE